ncbi:TetR family transcriptional regulator [Shewanella colwelliana]|uniref:TetR/AcrR family transcriptional regulator n=1 Tax=Shewanella colwelliana TaxID=23 RepID=UPI001BC45463|nr:TetR/AcrR family transcriptional regulator [Shewanella colwelliana]MDX1281771.1 TetR/AcrR family transcriptional regulator [Shewanella colwelliana]GIU22082.1 TetR family transcriptional regulator [Shewanella colwelliana]
MRNAEFDREKVLTQAMTAFMTKGYAKTSMQDLTKATGLHPGSIYCAFDNKRGLLLAALDQYRANRSAEFEAFFVDDSPTIEQLKRYLDHIVQQCLSCDASKACLLTKALNELAEQDEEVRTIINQHLENWQLALAQKFQRAIDHQQIDKHRDSAHLARYFVMGIYGLRTFAHSHPTSEVLQSLADQLYRDTCR